MASEAVQQPVVQPEGKAPLEASTWGKNAFYHHCRVTEQRRNFAACMNILLAIRDKRINEGSDYGGCVNAVKNGNCPAVAMRKEEIAAGHAIYYKERQIPVSIIEADPQPDVTGPRYPNHPSYMRGWASAGSKKSRPNDFKPAQTVVKATPKKPQGEDFSDITTVADAINQAVKEAGAE